MKKLDFSTAFKYPFNRALGLLNILWVFLPIFGWLALGGYNVRIIQEFSKGKFKKLPKMSFWSDFKLGFFMLVKAIPFMLVYFVYVLLITAVHPTLRLVSIPFEILALSLLSVHFINKQTVGSFFEFRILGSIVNNFGDYIVALLKNILLQLIFVVLSIVLVGIPAGTFTKNIFIADFYRRWVK